MVKILLWGSLRPLAEGQQEVEIEARNIKEILDGLAREYPALKPQIRRGVSVSVDGVIYRDSWFQPVHEGSEVVLMPYMGGG